MVSEPNSCDSFPDLIVRWTQEQAALIAGKCKEDSWLARVGFRVTSVGRTLVEKTLSRKLDETDMVLVYIGFRNLSSNAPTIDDIANRFFRGDFFSALAVVNALLTSMAVVFVDSECRETNRMEG